MDGHLGKGHMASSCRDKECHDCTAPLSTAHTTFLHARHRLGCASGLSTIDLGPTTCFQEACFGGRNALRVPTPQVSLKKLETSSARSTFFASLAFFRKCCASLTNRKLFLNIFLCPFWCRTSWSNISLALHLWHVLTLLLCHTALKAPGLQPHEASEAGQSLCCPINALVSLKAPRGKKAKVY